MAAHPLKNSQASHIVKIAIVFVLPILVLAVSFAAPNNPLYTSLRSAAHTAVLPLRAFGNVFYTPFKNAEFALQDSAQSQESYTALRERMEALEKENAELQEKVVLLDQLQALLDFKNSSSVSSMTASVIGRNVDSLTESLVINLGSTAGVSVGMAVVDGTGALGQVMSVGPFSATVRLITDERSSISAFDQQSRVVGQIVGTGAQDTVLFSHVPVTQTVNVGDTILTSGLGGAVPKGLLVGTVTSVDKPQGSQYYDITVKLSAEPQLAENVLVLTSMSDATSQDSQ